MLANIKYTAHAIKRKIYKFCTTYTVISACIHTTRRYKHIWWSLWYNHMVCLKIKELKSHLLGNKIEGERDKLKFLIAHETWLINKEVHDCLSYHTYIAFHNKHVIFFVWPYHILAITYFVFCVTHDQWSWTHWLKISASENIALSRHA